MEFSVVLLSLEEKESEFSILQNIIEIFKKSGSILKHVESRPSSPQNSTRAWQRLEYLITVENTDRLIAIELLRQLLAARYSIRWSDIGETIFWFPRSFDELGACAKSLYKYGPSLSEDNPGYGDSQYEERRQYFTEIASSYQLGETIPAVQYSENEIETWRKIYTHQKEFYPTHACKEQNEGMKLLEEHADYCAENIPQLERVSQYLKGRTGYQLCPVVGWIHSRDFLALLAFRVFPCTQYIRHHSRPYYTPEPDICHELLGHVPLFCNPDFADFSQSLGLASLGASDEWITKLSTLYWFTVEFGMVLENGSPKAYGAGLLSSCKEIEYCVKEEAERKPFDCSEAVLSTYPETGLQPFYYIAKSIQDVKAKMTDFSKTISKPVITTFNNETQSIDISSP